MSRIYDWIFHENTELEKELKEKRKAHQKDLIDSVIRPLSKHNSVSSVSSVNQQSAMEHLRIGYPDIWKLWFKDGFTLKSQVSEDETIIKEYIKNKSKEGILLYSDLEYIFNTTNLYDISKEQSWNDEGKVISKKEVELIYELLDEFKTKCPITENYKIENCKGIIETIKNDKNLNEIFERAGKNNELLKNKIKEFEQNLAKIVYDFEKWGSKLKGTCNNCKKR